MFGLEYSYWLAQKNRSRLALIYNFKLHNVSRIRRSHGYLQLALFEKEKTQSRTVTLLLCGTALFYTSDEINSMLNETGKLIILFNPDKKHGADVLNTWHLGDDIQVKTEFSEASATEKISRAIAILFGANSLASQYDYRISEFEAIRNRLTEVLDGATILSVYTKDIIAPFDSYFLLHLQAKEKIWKNIAPASIEHEYLRLLNRLDIPLTQIHFYSDYQKQTILNLGYLRNISVIKKIVVKPEPYFADLLKELAVGGSHENKEAKTLLVIGVWAHGENNRLRKNFEFSKFLFQIARNGSLKENYRLVYKPHPNKHHSQLFLAYLKAQGVEVRNASEKIIYLIKESDVVVSWGSMATVYAVGLRKKVVYPKNKYINFWVAYEKDDYEANDLVDVAESVHEVANSVLSGQSDEKAFRREKRLYEIFGLQSLWQRQ